MEGWVGLGTTTVSKQSVQDCYMTAVSCSSRNASLGNWSTGEHRTHKLSGRRPQYYHWATESPISQPLSCNSEAKSYTNSSICNGNDSKAKVKVWTVDTGIPQHKSAQVWHVSPADHSFTCNPCTCPRMEWSIPAFSLTAKTGPHLLTPKE